MQATVEVILVDGVGTPRLVPIVCEDGELPPFVGFAHEGRKSGPGRLIRFDHCPTTDINGLAVYRQEKTGDTAIRFAYLKPIDTRSAPFNPPKKAT